MRDVWVGFVAAPRAALGKAVPSCVNMCCPPRGQGGKLGASARSGCREALGLAPGLCAWPRPPQTATALPLRLGEVNWARLPAHSLCCAGATPLGVHRASTPSRRPQRAPQPSSRTPGRMAEEEFCVGPEGAGPRQPSLRAGAMSPPSGPGLLRILGLPALSTCSPGPGLCRNTLSPSPSPSPSAVAAHNLQPSCKDPTAVGQGLGASAPGPHRTSLAVTRKVVPTPPGTGYQPRCVGQSPCMGGENRGGRHEPQRREPCRRRVLWCSGRGRPGEQVGSGP